MRPSSRWRRSTRRSTSDTALVAVTQVCYRNGACIDLEGVIRLAHERGALVLVDAYQAIGTMPIDVHALGVDLLVAGALKYLLASAGLGFLYCRRELVEQLRPTATGWFADADVFAMDIQDYSPAADARRFQAGTPPIPSIYAGIAGIELMKEIGIEATRAHVSQLNETLIAGVDELGGNVVTPRDPAQRGALVAIRSTDEHALVGALAADGILTSSRDGNLRVSAHCYNTHEDIETLLAALKRHRALLAADAREPHQARAARRQAGLRLLRPLPRPGAGRRRRLPGLGLPDLRRRARHARAARVREPRALGRAARRHPDRARAGQPAARDPAPDGHGRAGLPGALGAGRRRCRARRAGREVRAARRRAGWRACARPTTASAARSASTCARPTRRRS